MTEVRESQFLQTPSKLEALGKAPLRLVPAKQSLKALGIALASLVVMVGYLVLRRKSLSELFNTVGEWTRWAKWGGKIGLKPWMIGVVVVGLPVVGMGIRAALVGKQGGAAGAKRELKRGGLRSIGIVQGLAVGLIGLLAIWDLGGVMQKASSGITAVGRLRCFGLFVGGAVLSVGAGVATSFTFPGTRMDNSAELYKQAAKIDHKESKISYWGKRVGTTVASVIWIPAILGLVGWGVFANLDKLGGLAGGLGLFIPLTVGGGVGAYFLGRKVWRSKTEAREEDTEEYYWKQLKDLYNQAKTPDKGSVANDLKVTQEQKAAYDRFMEHLTVDQKLSFTRWYYAAHKALLDAANTFEAVRQGWTARSTVAAQNYRAAQVVVAYLDKLVRCGLENEVKTLERVIEEQYNYIHSGHSPDQLPHQYLRGGMVLTQDLQFNIVNNP